MSTGILWKHEPISVDPSPKLPHGINLRSCPSLLSAWEYSAGRLNEIANAFHEAYEEPWFSISLSGSFGRLDAGPSSDADFLILVDELSRRSRIKQIIQDIRERLLDLNLPMPNPHGLFSQPVDVISINETIGDAEDTLFKLARRMVLLLETKCVYNERLFQKTIDEILQSYLKYQIREPEKQPLFLLNELIRYFRSICVNYESKFWHENEKWAIRNAKLRHSRIFMYFGLLSLILNSSVKENKQSYIRDHINLTPLERVCHVYSDVGESDVSQLLGPYNVFVENINNPEFRERLSLANYNSRYNFKEYVLMKTTSDAFRSEITRFILDRRGYWPHRVLSNILF